MFYLAFLHVVAEVGRRGRCFYDRSVFHGDPECGRVLTTMGETENRRAMQRECYSVLLGTKNVVFCLPLVMTQIVFNYLCLSNYSLFDYNSMHQIESYRALVIFEIGLVVSMFAM